MIKMGIIKLVSKPTEWVNSLVIEESQMALRICLDHRNLNKAIKRKYFQLPTAERIFTNMRGAK